MRRREFLVGVAAVAGLAGTRRAAAQARPPAAGVDEAKLARVAIMSLCFNSILKNATQPDNPARTLDILDLPQMLAERYRVHNVEMQHSHFPSTEPAFLKEFRDRVERTNSRITNINLEFGPQNISAADRTDRQQAVDRTKQWIDDAVALGCPRIMVNQGMPTEENKHVAIAALKAMGDYGTSKNIMVAMENRGSGGGDAAQQRQVRRQRAQRRLLLRPPRRPGRPGRRPGCSSSRSSKPRKRTRTAISATFQIRRPSMPECARCFHSPMATAT